MLKQATSGNSILRKLRYFCCTMLITLLMVILIGRRQLYAESHIMFDLESVIWFYVVTIVLQGLLAFWFLCEQERMHRVEHPIAYVFSMLIFIIYFIYVLVVLFQKVPELPPEKNRIKGKFGITVMYTIFLGVIFFASLASMIHRMNMY